MSDGEKKRGPDELPGTPRRASPRYRVKRRVDLRCASWSDFRKVFTENIGQRGILVLIDANPPEIGERTVIRLTELDGSTRDVKGEVVRIESGLEMSGRIGVAIKLDSDELDSMIAVIPSPTIPSLKGLKRPDSGRWSQAKRSDLDVGLSAPPITTPDAVTPVEPLRPARVVAAASAKPGIRDSSPGYVPPVPGPRDHQAQVKTGQRIQVGPPISPMSRTDEKKVGAPPPTPQPQLRPAPSLAGMPPRQQPKPAELATARPPAAGAGQEPAAPTPRDIRQIGSRRGWRSPAGTTRAGGTAPIVGIDFGTTYSKVAVFDGSEVILVEDTASKTSSRAAVPSIVSFLPDGSHLVGERAREMLATEPTQVISSVKRVMGLGYSDPLANGLLGSLACASRQGPNDSILFELHGRIVTVAEVCSRILGHLRDLVSDLVGARVVKGVFTVPVEFDTRARRDLEVAARMAGLEVVAMVPEPVAAAIGCGHDGSDQSLLAVYDFGGGTFDASIVEVGQNRFSVRGAAGDRWLGGDDFDEMLARHVADEFHVQTGIGLHNRAEEWQRLIFACEEAKRWLSTLDTVDVVLPRAATTPDGEVTLLVPVTRGGFEEITEDIITSSLEVCRAATSQAGVHPHEIQTVLVTGGTTRIPSVRLAAERFYDKPALAGIHPEHAVVIGAAVRAALVEGMSLPHGFGDRLRGFGTVGRNIGLALAGGTTEPIISTGQRPPTASLRRYSTSRDDQTTIRLELVQGDSTLTAENSRIGGFVIEDLPRRPAGTINLDVYFELSSTGTLYVTAQERSTGQRAQGTFDLSIL
jgi:molecular chaperone DnaK